MTREEIEELKHFVYEQDSDQIGNLTMEEFQSICKTTLALYDRIAELEAENARLREVVTEARLLDHELSQISWGDGHWLLLRGAWANLRVALAALKGDTPTQE